jgi:signal transduction histidine kinase
MALREQVGPELQDVLDRSRTLVAEGLAEAKAAVGALRDGSPAPAGVADLPGLVEVYRHDFGLDTALAVTGTTRPLPSPVEDALYRAAQEALTNAARHAPGSRVRLDLQWRHDCVALTVADSGPAPGAAPTPVGTGGGRGLVGMKERVAAAGGSVSAGPAALGWSVRVEVPG